MVRNQPSGIIAGAEVTCKHTQVEEVKHYMAGLTHIHMPKKGVIWRVNMAYDVLYNEVSTHVIDLLLVILCTGFG